MGSLLFQARLHPHSEGDALRVLHEWRRKGYSDRDILNMALLALDGAPVAATKDALLKRLNAAITRLEKLGMVAASPGGANGVGSLTDDLGEIGQILGGLSAVYVDEGTE